MATTEMRHSNNDDQQLLVDRISLEQRPGVLIVGSPNVGKRTLISRLLSIDFEDASDSSSEAQAYAWTINTKYYTAEVSVWMVHLHDELALATLPNFDRLAALVMVFDMNELSSLAAIKDWVSRTNIQNFDILLCIGNKADLLPGHEAHVEYKRRLQKVGQSSTDQYLESSEYGISETEGTSLLGGDDSSWETKQSCQEWCIEHNIEYLEACASNSDFDKCLSVNGDSQGVERLLGALSAHMWPGMILKSGDRINEPSLPDTQELSEEDSDYEVDYERLSGGSAEAWDDTDGGWVSAKDSGATTDAGSSVVQNTNSKKCDNSTENGSVEEQQLPSTSVSHLQEDIENKEIPDEHEAEKTSKLDEGAHYDFEDLEQLMSEIGNMRENLRLMPDFQRREMAAKVAMKMAAMFGESSGDEEGST